MKFCEVCKKEIDKEELGSVFHFTLGDMKNGIFYGKNTNYYHTKCIRLDSLNEWDVIIELIK